MSIFRRKVYQKMSRKDYMLFSNRLLYSLAATAEVPLVSAIGKTEAAKELFDVLFLWPHIGFKML